MTSASAAVLQAPRSRFHWPAARGSIIPLLHVAHLRRSGRIANSADRDAGIHAAKAAGVAAGAGAAFDTFVEEHQRSIVNYLWRMTGDEQCAFDLTQDVFIRAWQRFDTLRAYEQPRAWLFRVATNLALTYLKRRGLPNHKATVLEDDAAFSVGDPASQLAESDLVRRTLLQLSPKRRAALVLREVYGFSAAEVGQVLGMSDSAVRMALHRAREQFRDLYMRDGGLNRG